MMFVGSKWKVALVTTHLPMREVPEQVTVERILTVIRLTAEGLKYFFGIPTPRIAVLGLNPHCGEEGLFGAEEKNAILPAIAKAKSVGMDTEGPFSADSFFSLPGSPSFHAVIAMYHDQGLIPIKMSGFSEAVNLTLGLPIIRTSVGHGTAYDIAGKGLADPTNLIHALSIASKLAKLKNNPPHPIPLP
jgi:4-hydroxythreonine-4-phosphate dehydrogenase